MSETSVTEQTIDVADLERRSRRVRATCVQMAFEGQHGHLGSALSCVDVLVALYGGFLRVSADTPFDADRDRLVFSKGHACTALYAVLADFGFFPRSWLADYAQADAPLAVHPCKHALPLLECSSGSLGHGLGIATGMLYGHRLDGRHTRAVVLMSDGECNEGSVWEAAMFAAAKGLENLLAVVDYNGIQAVGRSDEVMGHTDLAAKFRAFGWGARTVDGHSMADILRTFSTFPFERGRPSVVVARTRKGAGVPFMEDQVLWHYRVPSSEEVAAACSALAAAPLHKD